jgi:hypothetical protein
LFLFFAFAYWLYQFWGLKHYLQALSAINKLSGEAKVQARNSLYGVNENGVYSGILAGFSRLGKGEVWIWGKSGLKYFAVDGHTAYSLFAACTEENLNDLAETGTMTINQSVTNDYGEFTSQVKAGNFAGVIFSGQYANEVKVNDWWVFMPIDIQKQCAD